MLKVELIQVSFHHVMTSIHSHALTFILCYIVDLSFLGVNYQVFVGGSRVGLSGTSASAPFAAALGKFSSSSYLCVTSPLTDYMQCCTCA